MRTSFLGFFYQKKTYVNVLLCVARRVTFFFSGKREKRAFLVFFAGVRAINCEVSF